MTRKRQRETRVPSKIYHLSIFVNFKVTKNRKEVMPKGPKSIALAKIQKVTHMNQLIVPIHPVSAILPSVHVVSFLSILRFLMAFLQLDQKGGKILQLARPIWENPNLKFLAKLKSPK